ncbi:heavy metal-binding domain-containing protein [Shewanella aestuarii]|uniref:heavy metal-binding domain-containing protein n=1 Tax=Shewanella aestuarii TaxID=1028752 RepID=UPI001FCB6043|nr:heavy metal-binding domain-containing protein [Shewanella aestuarii]
MSSFAYATEHNHSAHTLAEKTYVCPMHADVTDSQPSRCPKCNMFLVEKADDANATKSAIQSVAVEHYYCPMHPEVTSHEGEGAPNVICS